MDCDCYHRIIGHPFSVCDRRSLHRGRGKDDVAQLQASPTWWKSAPAFWPISLLWQRQGISKQEFQSRFDQARLQQRAQQGEGFDAREFETLSNKRKLLDQLIEEHVMRLVAEGAGVVISDEAVRTIIANDQRFQVKGKFNQDRYRLLLAQEPTMRTPQMYESYVRSMMQLSMIPSAILILGLYRTPSWSEYSRYSARLAMLSSSLYRR